MNASQLAQLVMRIGLGINRGHRDNNRGLWVRPDGKDCDICPTGPERTPPADCWNYSVAVLINHAPNRL